MTVSSSRVRRKGRDMSMVSTESGSLFDTHGEQLRFFIRDALVQLLTY
ncbi:hypothetical protein V5R04_07105 [Jonesiaceae bacterium BS-20]|uniref:Uncharacterized protein n=1 Tax=Jonesiaceae bacterium BS-20 TaxID=3120821 RepID=A0AAU7E095_9MICO